MGTTPVLPKPNPLSSKKVNNVLIVENEIISREQQELIFLQRENKVLKSKI